MKHIKVRTIDEAITELNRNFPTDYMKNDELSERAGYPTYESTADGCNARWNDLGCRYEIILEDAEDITIWIEQDAFEALSQSEKDEVIGLFAFWLSGYTHEVVVKVMEQRNEIIKNKFAMNLLREYKARREQEQKSYTNSIAMLFSDFDTFKEYDINNHPLEHASSYADILRDMYIK